MLKNIASMLLCLSFVPLCPAVAGDAPPLDAKINGGILPARYGKLPLLWIPKLADPAKLVGNLSDPVWNSAAHFSLLGTVSGEPLPLATEALLFCSDSAFYVGVRCQEPKLGELVVTQDDLWANDSIELFLEPYKDTIQKPYHQVVVNNAGKTEAHRYHLYQKVRNSAPLGETVWKPKLEIATGRTDKEWMLEIKLPFKEMMIGEDARKKQTLWRMNLYRTRPAKSDSKDSLSWALSPPRVARYHEPGKFAYALPETFATKEFIDTVVRTAPVSEPDKPVDPAEVEKRLAELGSDSFDTRQAAVDRLREIFHANAKMAETVEARLKQLVEQTKVAETWAAAHDALTILKVDIDNEDDPPPGGN
jgi:hypothetical protein